MVGTGEGSGDNRAPCQVSDSRKVFWRSASWSASRSSLHNSEAEEKESVDPNGNVGNSNGHIRRFPAPLTPRSQQNCKARSYLPPLQPLSIARRSLDEWPKAGSDDIGEWLQPPTPSGRGNGERLKLDLSTIQQNPDKNGGLVKRDKIAFFDKECSKVAEHVYLGGDAVARDRDILKHNGITHILNCVGFVCPEYFRADFTYRTLWLQDSPSEDITSILYDVFDYFEDVREQGGRVFVHCCQGVSRSTSLVIAYLMWREGQSFDDAFQYVKAARGIADPNMGFACQLLQCQKRVHAVPLSPSSLLRMYRMAPHSPYDPLHLVPKMLNDPSPCALDSRGAFIVHIPSAIYVWIGKHCEAIMERDARAAVCQIVRYERVQGPITVIKEGEEPAYFWDAFTNLLPLMDKSGNAVNVGEMTLRVLPGERKVDSYDVDIEIFLKAITGGFVPPFASSENDHETHLPARESSWSMLRRKFATGNMKEFVSAPRISLSRVYSDSMMVIHSVAKAFSPSLSASSSSSSATTPNYLSPDSISSDSSTNSSCRTEIIIDSPSKVLSPLPMSSTFPDFSNLSLVSPRNSSLPIPGNKEALGTMLTSEASSQSSLTHPKKFSPSLAERRGSLSKFLKLPMKTDKVKDTRNSSSLDVTQRDGDGMSNATSSFHDAHGIVNAPGSMCHVDNGVIDLDPKRGSVFENAAQGRGASTDPCQQRRTILNNMGASGLVERNPVKLLVYLLPSLEKVVNFSVNDLDPTSALAIFCPGTSSGKRHNRTLYVWIGSSFDYGKFQVWLDSDRELDYQQKTDWHQVGRNVLTQVGLPEDAEIKVIKEDKEKEDFLSLWSLLERQHD